MSDGENIDPAINEVPDPHAFANAGGVVKKARKRRAVEEPGGLSMNSLMDIMTIILVFLLKSYSSDPVQLKAAPDLKPPFSTSELKPAQSTTVTITLNNILVDDSPVMKVESGKVPESDRSSGGFLIDPLFEKLTDAVEHQKKVLKYRKDKEFSDIITVIADRHVPFELLSQVMYTAGQAQFAKFKFMVVKGSG